VKKTKKVSFSPLLLLRLTSPMHLLTIAVERSFQRLFLAGQRQSATINKAS
jgi:hypothetical protein